jgi:hypothetical protein
MRKTIVKKCKSGIKKLIFPYSQTSKTAIMSKCSFEPGMLEGSIVLIGGDRIIESS